jgi:hypothetical protein
MDSEPLPLVCRKSCLSEGAICKAGFCRILYVYRERFVLVGKRSARRGEFSIFWNMPMTHVPFDDIQILGWNLSPGQECLGSESGQLRIWTWKWMFGKRQRQRKTENMDSFYAFSWQAPTYPWRLYSNSYLHPRLALPSWCFFYNT